MFRHVLAHVSGMAHTMPMSHTTMSAVHSIYVAVVIRLHEGKAWWHSQLAGLCGTQVNYDNSLWSPGMAEAKRT